MSKELVRVGIEPN